MPVVPRRLVDREPSYGAPSHLGIVLRAVCDIITEAGDPTPVMVGAQYAKAPRGVGSPPCVIIVPEPDDGKCKIDAPYEAGRDARQVHECDVIVRAAEDGSDLGHLDAAYALNDRVISAVRRAGRGRIVYGEPTGAYPTPFNVDTGAGTQLSWGFTYDRDIRGDDALARVPAAAADDTPARPLSPPGSTGSLETIDGATTPQG